MTESKEYSTIVKCSRKLEIALKNDREIVQFLHEQGLITTDDYDVVSSPISRFPPAEKSSVLVAAIRDRIELHPRNYHVVVNYMCQNSTRYRDIIEILDKEYQGETVTPNSMMAIPTSPSVPNLPSKGATFMLAIPPSGSSLSASMTQSSTEGATVSNDNSGEIRILI